ncbi:MAG: pyridoxal phosphate-dependent aminotransferase [Candidatus Margulisbacteria bacterium]|jgi:aspartate aminotransferase|nr:pyridoxal phosphate-dependent aminotransferase [Candidatus Margulisiibacteriota bacterium]
MNLADRVGRVRASKTLAVTAQAAALKALGKAVINFGAGEPDYDTPDNIKSAAIEAIQQGFTKYTAAGGTPDLKKAIQEKLRRDNGLTYGLEQIIVSAGAKYSIYSLFQILLNAGDEVLIPAPYWVSYPDMVLLADGVPVIVPTSAENNFELTIDDLQKNITPRTKVLVLNSPSNPTGSVYAPEKLRAIAEFLEDRDIFIISDEIYEYFLYGGAKFYSIAQFSDKIRAKTIVVNGVSKSYSMTGWRIGYAAGPAYIVRAMETLQSQSVSNPASIAQAAAVEAIRGDQSSVGRMVCAFQSRRDYIVGAFQKIAGIQCPCPQGAFYVFPAVSALYGKTYKGQKIAGSLELAGALLSEKLVAVVPGIAFGDDNYIRLSYACSTECVEDGLSRIADFVRDLV